MASLIDENGKWIGPGPDPRAPASTPVAPARFDPTAIPTFGGTTGPGGVDWKNLIQADPGYMNSNLSLSERSDSAAANRKAALRAIAMQYGGLAPGIRDVYGDLDQQTLDTAAANPLSDLARLRKSGADNTEQYKRQLAARGALQSGDLGYGLDQINYNQNASEYDLGQQYGNAAQGAVNDYAGILQGLNSEQLAAIQDAAARIIAANPDGIGGATPPGTTTTTDTSASDVTPRAETEAERQARMWLDAYNNPNAPDVIKRRTDTPQYV